MPAKWEFSSEGPPRLNSLRDKPGSDALKIIKFEMLKLNDFCFGKTCNAITHASMGSRKVLEFFFFIRFHEYHCDVGSISNEISILCQNTT